MNRNLIIVLAGGFLIAVLVAVIVQAGLKGGDKEVVADGPRVEIVVAAENLKVGVELNDKNMKWQEWPANATFPGAVIRKDGKKPSEMISGRLQRPVTAGEPLMESALVSKEGNLVAAMLGEGMRAVAVDVTAVKMAGGVIGPGDFVDVILTYKDAYKYEGENKEVEEYIEMNINRLASETILQNVKVLAVDQTTKRDDEGEEKKKKVGKTVTLEVDPRGAEILALARQMGEISLSLRRLGDDQQYTQASNVVTDKRITTLSDEIHREIIRIQNTSGQNGDIVRIYNGYTVSEMPVR